MKRRTFIQALVAVAAYPAALFAKQDVPIAPQEPASVWGGMSNGGTFIFEGGGHVDGPNQRVTRAKIFERDGDLWWRPIEDDAAAQLDLNEKSIESFLQSAATPGSGLTCPS